MSKEPTYLDLRKLQRTLDDLADTFATLRLPGEPGEPGEPGQDADPEYVRQLVQEAVDAIPRPVNGKDADPEVLRQMVARAVADIPKPRAGKDADPETIRAMVDAAFSRLRVPRDGKPGKAGNPGVGIPPGGKKGWALEKDSDEDYDTIWVKRDGAGSFSMWNATTSSGTGTGTTSTLFGTGDPTGTAADGTLYFDRTDPAVYAGWVFDAFDNDWHPFAGTGTVTPTTTGVPIGLLLALTQEVSI